MSDLTWRPATPEDAARLTTLFGRIARAAPIGLETDLAEVQARLSAPRLDPSRDTLIAVGPDGGIVAYAEAADMGVGDGRMRIRLTHAAAPGPDDEAARTATRWLLDRAAHLRAERHPDLPAVLGTRCAAADTAGLSRWTDAGFTIANRHHDLVRPAEPAAAPVPACGGVVIEPFDHRRDQAAWAAHNDAHADLPGALLPDAANWPQHATGLGNFLPDASFLALTADNDGPEIVAFLFSLEHRDEDGAREASLHCMGTRRPWRRRGIATALIGHALAAYHRAGLTRVRLQVSASNTAAATLYQRLGFVDSGHGYTILHRALD